MTVWDAFITPFIILIIFTIAQVFRGRIKDKTLRSYFLGALRVKIIGAIALGLVYQFYYGGGDTFNFYRDSTIIWNSFLESPSLWLKIILAPVGTKSPDVYAYTKNIYYFAAGDGVTYNVIRVSAFFSIFTLNTYSGIAVLFAVTSFTGVWAMYRVFYNMYPMLHRPLAYAVFFIPSVYFWGSGLMKDSLSLGALGWVFYAFYFGLMKREKIITNVIIMLVASWCLYNIKSYILFAFMGGALIWLFLEYRANIRNPALRLLMLPVMIVGGSVSSYVAVLQLTENDARYDVDNIADTARVSSEWLEYLADKQQGSVYSLGITDWSPAGILSKAPQAIWLSLFQPHPWQARNPIMLLSAIEVTFFLWLTLRVLFQNNPFIILNTFIEHPILLLCLIFSIVLGIAVAVTSGNYGSVVRYRIPYQPFYLAMLYILRYVLNKKTTLY